MAYLRQISNSRERQAPKLGLPKPSSQLGNKSKPKTPDGLPLFIPCDPPPILGLPIAFVCASACVVFAVASAAQGLYVVRVEDEVWPHGHFGYVVNDEVSVCAALLAAVLVTLESDGS